MKYVIQDLYKNDIWDERPGRFYSLESAIAEVGAAPEAEIVQIVAIPSGNVVWNSERGQS